MPSVALRRYPRFDTYLAFESFDAELTRQLSTGQWVAVAPPVSAELPDQVTAYYQPPGSGQVWALSEPDNAWRGYFLPVEEALAYSGKLRRHDQRRRLGCLVGLGLAAALLLWRLICWL